MPRAVAAGCDQAEGWRARARARAERAGREPARCGYQRRRGRDAARARLGGDGGGARGGGEAVVEGGARGRSRPLRLVHGACRPFLHGVGRCEQVRAAARHRLRARRIHAGQPDRVCASSQLIARCVGACLLPLMHACALSHYTTAQSCARYVRCAAVQTSSRLPCCPLSPPNTLDRSNLRPTPTAYSELARSPPMSIHLAAV
mmetsp:Transcript_3827/g.8213  ORF Transcript_3827/g.8213 Transcript_3827/m.8213 type:complete len:203 (-) Transcript_3827:246-854(-)|eukprot:5431582-Pleurochrysis_carterae.AAC.2